MNTVPKKSVAGNVVRVFRCYRRTELPLRPVLFCMLLALTASCFEMCSLALLVPTIKAVMAQDFGFISDNKWLSSFVNLMPKGSVSNPFWMTVLLLALTFGAAVGKTLFSLLSMIGLSRMVRRFAHRLRTRIYARFLSFGSLYFAQRSVGQLQGLITTYVSAVSFVLINFNDFFFVSITLLVYLLMLFVISWPLTLVVIAVVPIITLCYSTIIKRLQQRSASYTERYNEMARGIWNCLTCLPLVKAYNDEARQQEKMTNASESTALLEFSIDKNRLVINPIVEVIVLTFLLGLVVVITYLVRGSPTSIAKYLVFLFILRRSGMLFGSLSGNRAALASIYGMLNEIDEVFSDEGKFFLKNGAKPFLGLSSAVEFRNVSFVYPGRVHALYNINFSVNKGEVTAIVGTSGSGKSTTINLLMRFLDPSEGTIAVDGVDLRDYDIAGWRDKLALVSQETFLLNGSLRENLLFGLPDTIDDRLLLSALRDARLDGMLARMARGLDTEIGDRGMNLSGGERQRISIARALLKNPQILLLDEATSSLDSATESLVQAALEELIRGKTTLVIAHRLSTIRHAHKILVLEDGKIVEEGTLEQLLSEKGPFYRSWSMQNSFRLLAPAHPV